MSNANPRRCIYQVWDPRRFPLWPFMSPRCANEALSGSELCQKHHEMYAAHAVLAEQLGAARVELLKDGDDDA